MPPCSAAVSSSYVAETLFLLVKDPQEHQVPIATATGFFSLEVTCDSTDYLGESVEGTEFAAWE